MGLHWYRFLDYIFAPFRPHYSRLLGYIYVASEATTGILQQVRYKAQCHTLLQGISRRIQIMKSGLRRILQGEGYNFTSLPASGHIQTSKNILEVEITHFAT